MRNLAGSKSKMWGSRQPLGSLPCSFESDSRNSFDFSNFGGFKASDFMAKDLGNDLENQQLLEEAGKNSMSVVTKF